MYVWSLAEPEVELDKQIPNTCWLYSEMTLLEFLDHENINNVKSLLAISVSEILGVP